MKKFLFLPGGLMIVAGLMWSAFALAWDTTATVLAGGGLLALAVAIAANWQHVRDWFRDPRGIFVINSILTTMLLVAVLGLVNGIASFRAAPDPRGADRPPRGTATAWGGLPAPGAPVPGNDDEPATVSTVADPTTLTRSTRER